jgi:hypothetical protein
MLKESKYLEKSSIIYTPCSKVKVIKSKFIKAALILLRNFDFANL